MRFLLDTNCWLQVIREREHVASVRALLMEVESSRVCLTDFTLHSICITRRKFGMGTRFNDFLHETAVGSAISLLRLTSSDLMKVMSASHSFNLDVDDAYQYTAAHLFGCSLVSFDSDFDRTRQRKLTPEQALTVYRQQRI